MLEVQEQFLLTFVALEKKVENRWIFKGVSNPKVEGVARLNHTEFWACKQLNSIWMNS